MLRVKTVAERLGISGAKVYSLIETGKLPHFRFDGSIRVSEEQLKEYIDSCRHGRKQEEWPDGSNPMKPVKLKHIKF